VHAAGGYTAWIDKHPSYSMAAGPGGRGLDDFYSPEVSSSAVPLPGVRTSLGVPCAPLRDTVGAPSAWNSSFANIQCYDSLKVAALKRARIYDDTLLIVTAKHGDSPIDPTRYVADGNNTPATLLGSAIPYSESPLNTTGIGATEDDVSVLWLNKGASVADALALLENDATAIGMGEIYYGPTLWLNYNVGGWDAGQDPRTPDIIVTPNVGVTYSGSTTMIGDHGGFARDDTNVLLLIANPRFRAQTVWSATTTAQVAPTVLEALALEPQALDAVRIEGTAVLPEVAAQLARSDH
jgi:arylsulfatase A-like enzyme